MRGIGVSHCFPHRYLERLDCLQPFTRNTSCNPGLPATLTLRNTYFHSVCAATEEEKKCWDANAARKQKNELGWLEVDRLLLGGWYTLSNNTHITLVICVPMCCMTTKKKREEQRMCCVCAADVAFKRKVSGSNGEPEAACVSARPCVSACLRAPVKVRQSGRQVGGRRGNQQVYVTAPARRRGNGWRRAEQGTGELQGEDAPRTTRERRRQNRDGDMMWMGVRKWQRWNGVGLVKLAETLPTHHIYFSMNWYWTASELAC